LAKSRADEKGADLAIALVCVGARQSLMLMPATAAKSSGSLGVEVHHLVERDAARAFAATDTGAPA
jgi:hypothetical protein